VRRDRKAPDLCRIGIEKLLCAIDNECGRQRGSVCPIEKVETSDRLVVACVSGVQETKHWAQQWLEITTINNDLGAHEHEKQLGL